MMCLHESLVDAALAYYAEHTAEIDAWIAAQEEATKKHQALWERQRALLAQ